MVPRLMSHDPALDVFIFHVSHSVVLVMLHTVQSTAFPVLLVDKLCLLTDFPKLIIRLAWFTEGVKWQI